MLYESGDSGHFWLILVLWEKTFHLFNSECDVRCGVGCGLYCYMLPSYPLSWEFLKIINGCWLLSIFYLLSLFTVFKIFHFPFFLFAFCGFNCTFYIVSFSLLSRIVIELKNLSRRPRIYNIYIYKYFYCNGVWINYTKLT